MIISMHTQKSGFTLIELMIVIVIIGILASIAIPNFLSLRARAKVASLKANMHTIQIAAEDFGVMAEGFYPEGKNTKVEDVLEELGYVGVENKKSLSANRNKPPFEVDALLPKEFKNPFKAENPAILNGEPPANPPPGRCEYTGFNLIGIEGARGYSICAYGQDRPLNLILSNGG